MGGFADRTIESLFFAGEHRSVADRTIDAPSPTYSLEEFPHVVGALVMLGRTEEAEMAYVLRREQLTHPQRVACRFFLGVGFCRHSFYEKSRRYFVENLSSRRQADDAISRYYRAQGLGFYHYFAGRMKRALVWSERSFAAALEGGFLYGRAFAADLKGHALLQTGQVGLGLKTLELAAHLASQLGAKWLQETVRSSLLTYRARFGIDGEASLDQLLSALKALSKQDIYTQSSLLLEISGEHLRRGRLTEAKTTLNDCCRIVYGSHNRRHAAMLNLKYAYVHYREGEPHLALNLVRNALTQIDTRVDVLLELKLRGFERKLVNLLGIEVCQVALEEKVTRLSKRAEEAVGLRMLAREKSLSGAGIRYGEDPIGDLWDKMQREGAGASDAILKSGYLGLLPEVLPVRGEERVLYLDLEPGSLTVFDKGDVEHHAELMSRSLRALLLEIRKGPKTKEELIQNIWKYEYHPLRHDTLIYSAIAKLRKVLASRAHWIEVSEAGYQLRNQIRVMVHENGVASAPVNESHEPEPAPRAALNHRQEKILRFLKENEFIDTGTCRTLFETSEITASRDLSELLKLELVGRVGKGRATKYRRKNLEEGNLQ